MSARDLNVEMSTAGAVDLQLKGCSLSFCELGSSITEFYMFIYAKYTKVYIHARMCTSLFIIARVIIVQLYFVIFM